MNQSKVYYRQNKDIKIEFFKEPFPHVVIDNLFNDEDYRQICEKFPQFISRTKPYKDSPGATSQYDAYIYGIKKEDTVGNAYSFFASRDFQEFVESTFEIKTSKYIAPSAHFHLAPSKDGFIHRDMNICAFVENNQTDDFVFTGETEYTNDLKIANKENEIKVARSVACLFYLDNDNSEKAVGGGTGIYSSYEGGLVKSIEPKNNRLFLFEINNESFHAFIGANFDRSAIVTWFHSKPAEFCKRFIDKYQKLPLFEAWNIKKQGERWRIEDDPDFANQFGGA